jgi:transcriptional regulator with XRE-family HTH domain
MESHGKHTRENTALASYSIGLKLRTLRSQKGLTLSRLAAETELSTALLSKLETDRMIPTLQTLVRLCRVYGVGLDYFFSTVERQHLFAITRQAHIQDQTRGQQTIRSIPLHVPSADGALIAEIIDFPPNSPVNMQKHGSLAKIVAYVIAGTVEIDVAGAKETLAAGDCAVLNTEASVIWSASGGHQCRALIVTARAKNVV